MLEIVRFHILATARRRARNPWRCERPDRRRATRAIGRVGYPFDSARIHRSAGSKGVRPAAGAVGRWCAPISDRVAAGRFRGASWRCSRAALAAPAGRAACCVSVRLPAPVVRRRGAPDPCQRAEVVAVPWPTGGEVKRPGAAVAGEAAGDRRSICGAECGRRGRSCRVARSVVSI